MASSLEGNKLIAAVLTAGIIASASGVFSRIIYSPHDLEEPAYPIAVAEAPAEGEAEQAEATPIAVRLASADPAGGEAAAKRCVSCHSLEQGGANKVGPALWDVVGRPIGGHEGFAYSPAMAEHGGNWDYEALDQFLANPKAYVPGTKMAFAGIGKEQERADLIAYLRGLSANPQPLPEG